MDLNHKLTILSIPDLGYGWVMMQTFITETLAFIYFWNAWMIRLWWGLCPCCCWNSRRFCWWFCCCPEVLPFYFHLWTNYFCFLNEEWVLPIHLGCDSLVASFDAAYDRVNFPSGLISHLGTTYLSTGAVLY